MVLEGKELLDLLVRENYVPEAEAKKALEANSDDPVEHLINLEIVNRELIGQAIAERYGTKLFSLKDNEIDKASTDKLPEEIARDKRLVPISTSGNEFTTDSPDEIEDLKRLLKQDYKIKTAKIYYSSKEDIDCLLGYYKKPLSTRFSKIIESQRQIAPEIINEIIDDAISFKASDIHFEPEEGEVIVRFRVDGVLQEAGRIPKDYYDNILNRIKVLAQLRIDEHFATQDGAIRLDRNGIHIDMRVAIAPTLNGENVVIRLLSEYVKDLTLSELGLSDNDQEMLVRVAKKPFGMVLVSGPTGSGKSTTLYALLKHINTPSVNITTIEDPVEYRIIGTNQIQVNEDKDITFAKGLRSIVRQDPDIILVGEIRDQETAEISVNAALTGHLLFTTFHANDAATSIPRLLEMNVEPFLLASTLELVVAQRLVRTICNNCRTSTDITASAIEKEYPGWGKFFAKSQTLYHGKGCEVCNGTGYKGRVAIFEFIEMNKKLKNFILSSPSTDDIWTMAKSQGAHSLLEDGIMKVKNGVTTVEELSRVVPLEN